MAGSGAGLNGKRSGTFRPFWELVQAGIASGRIPKLIVLENVVGTLTSHAGKDFNFIVNALHESGFREFAGIIFNKIVRIVLWLPFVDTQCGFKAFRRERCEILFEQQRIERFGFDPELLYLARHHGLKSVEIPVRWSHSPATKVNMLRDSVQMFLDVFTIRWNAILRRYRKQN